MTTAGIIDDRAADRSFNSRRMLGNCFPHSGSKNRKSFPLVDISESEEAYMLRAELPGFVKGDLDVVYEDQMLILRGKRRPNSDRGHVLQSERFFGEFERLFRLGEKVDPSKFNARYRDGVLTVSIPKSKKPGVLEIKVN